MLVGCATSKPTYTPPSTVGVSTAISTARESVHGAMTSSTNVSTEIHQALTDNHDKAVAEHLNLALDALNKVNDQLFTTTNALNTATERTDTLTKQILQQTKDLNDEADKNKKLTAKYEESQEKLWWYRKEHMILAGVLTVIVGIAALKAYGKLAMFGI